METQEKKTAACGLCGEPTRMLGTERCERCWELERRVTADPLIAMLILARAGKLNPDGFVDVLELHRKFSLPMQRTPQLLTHELFGMRSTFMLSELVEFQDAHWAGDLTKCADSLLDLVYVAKGTAVAMGIPWLRVWPLVHAANMAKERLPDLRTGFKHSLSKPPGWKSPNDAIEAELARAGAK